MKDAQTLSILPLLVYLCLFLLSSHVLSAATVPQQDLNVNAESSFATRSNPSLIQQTMTWILSFLKSLLTYKALFVIIPIIVIWMWYDHDDVSMQKKPSKERVSKKSPSGQRQSHQPDSSESLKSSKGKGQPDTEKSGVKVQQDQVVGGKRKSEPLRQKEQLNVSNKRGSENSSQSQKSGHTSESSEPNHPNIKPAELSKLKPPERRQKSNDESLNIGRVPSQNELIKRSRLGNKRIRPQHKDKRMGIHESSLEELSGGENPPYPESDLKSLAATPKYTGFQFEKLPNMGKEAANLYMLHPTYKTQVISMELRSLMIKYDNMDTSHYTALIFESFDKFYERLLDSAKKVEVTSYESFRTIVFSDFYTSFVDMTVKHFFTLKFLETPKWTLEQLQNSRNLLREELEQIIKDFHGSPSYSFISHVHLEMDKGLYNRIWKTVKPMDVPFYNCFNILLLLISSKQEPLRLFLFWDIFDALEMEILFNAEMGRNHMPSLKDQIYVKELIRSIPKVYTSQNKDYLELLCYEMIEFIQQDFFGNDQLYKKSEPGKQHRAAFEDYMLDVQTRVKTFLTTKVFSNPSVRIKIKDH